MNEWRFVRGPQVEIEVKSSVALTQFYNRSNVWWFCLTAKKLSWAKVESDGIFHSLTRELGETNNLKKYKMSQRL